jgi:uncharacterized zinc-type alcohol dehydrogenase-like protein
MPVRGYAAKAPRESLVPYEYTLAPLGPYDVEIAITHCGICHSDIHLIDNDWGISQYPLVPGHEIVGEITKVGTEVRTFGEGDRVGVGWQCGACLECEWCASGHDNLCPDSRATCVGRPGGFSEKVVVDSRYTFIIPENMTSHNAAPLLCGGVTVYSPLSHFNVRPEMKVGVIGIGGLGHLAIQFAQAFGCEVTAFSSSPAKEVEARVFGADHFINLSDKDQLAAAASTLDFILATPYVDLEWQTFVDILRPRGNLCFVGAVPNPVQVHAMSLLVGNKMVSGSPIGSRQTIREMLEFAARHGIEARTEVVPMSQVNDAIAKVRANRARYRMVLKN